MSSTIKGILEDGAHEQGDSDETGFKLGILVLLVSTQKSARKLEVCPSFFFFSYSGNGTDICFYNLTP